MIAPGSVLLLLGSPKKGMSTSEALADYFLDRLADHGVHGRVVRLHRALREQASCDELRALIDAADLVVLATPLYADSLPSHVIAALETIAGCRARRPAGDSTRTQALACIVNCGFPEARQTDTAIRICRCFAREAEFEWMGALGLGGGEAIGGRPLGKLGGMVRHVVAALDLAAHALASGSAIPDEAVRLMVRPMVPPVVFRMMGDVSWRVRAREFGAQWRIHAQPYFGP